MHHELSRLYDVMVSATTLAWGRAIIIVILGFLIAQVVARVAGRLTVNRLDLHRATLIRRLLFYGLFLIAIVLALRQVSHDISNIFLGAAGILSVAVGFASQTSASNLISGLFLIGEKSFAIGDTITIGQTTGEVLSIDLLSVKLRTFDNLLVRVPNETLVKSEITNLTRFPIRRIDMQISVGEKEDIARVRELLMDVADRNPTALIEPRPEVRFSAFGDNSFDLQFCIWTKRENYLVTRNSLAEDIIGAFRQHNIELPYPYRALTLGSASEPFPIRVVRDKDESTGK
ncbi:MAG TPA: mechanosensitive ion channel family protein [Gammaproteobacteria bacterium]|nr:mechanosensitive ion channel family protein [Gammaproteobacteria bacterium]